MPPAPRTIRCARCGRACLVLSALRRGRPGPARALLARVRHLSAVTLPPIVKARCDLLGDLLVESDPAGAVKRRVAATGLPALVLFAEMTVRGVRLQADPCGAGPAKAGHPVLGQPDFLFLDDSIEILQCCQSGDDEHAVLAGVCARLRARLNASAVAFFAKADPASTPLAIDGRIEPGIAERIIATGAGGQQIGPDLRDGRIEGGAVVRYGGEVIGALAARWTIGSLGSSADRARAGAVLRDGRSRGRPRGGRARGTATRA